MAKRIVTQAVLEALRTGFKTDFQSGLGKASNQYQLFCTEVNSSTSLETYGFLGDFPKFREWIGEKRIKQMKERVYQLVNRSFEQSRGIHKHKIEDDNLGLYGPLVNGWGQSGGQLKDELAFDALRHGHQNPCYDGQNFFDDEHPIGDGANEKLVSNMSGDGSGQPWYLIDASQPLMPILMQNRQEATFDMLTDMKSDHVFLKGEYLMSAEARHAAGYTFWQLAHRCNGALNKDNYEEAYQAMEALTDDEGEPLNISPTHIIVGRTNKAAAKQLFDAQLIGGGDSNIYYKDVEIVHARRLP